MSKLKRSIFKIEIVSSLISLITRPAWAGFKTAEERRAKIEKLYYTIHDVL
jgi:hypothetical protein